MTTAWRRWATRATSLALAFLVAAPATAVAAGPALPDGVLEAGTPITGVVLDGEPGEPISGGRIWSHTDPSDIFVMDTTTPSWLVVSIQADDAWWWINVRAPDGATLVPGTYEAAERAAFASPGHPGLDVFGNGIGCNTVAGRFTVHEAAWGGDGRPTAFAASLEQQCDGMEAALFVEVRVASTLGLTAVTAAPASLSFGQQAFGTQSDPQEVTVTSTGNADAIVSSVTLEGPDADQYAIATDGCAAQTLAPGASCAISVRFAPSRWSSDNWARLAVAYQGSHSAVKVFLGGQGVITAATNDAIADALVVAQLPFRHLTDASATTADPSDPPCFSAGPTAWYRFTPATTAQYEASTLGSTYPTVLCVFTGEPGGLVQVAGNDDADGTGKSRVLFAGQAGVTHHVMVGTNQGYAPQTLDFSLKVGPPDQAVSATGLGVSPATFYPYKDGYRDTLAIGGKASEWVTVEVWVKNASGKVVRSWTPFKDIGTYGVTWNGRTASGSAVAAGTYTVVQRLTDLLGNKLTKSSSAAVSWKRLVTYSGSKTLYGAQYAYYGDPGRGTISKSGSAYARGVRISSSTSWVAVGYAFSLPAATVYKSVSFKVLGRSPNGRRAYEAVWRPGYGSYLYTSSYDLTRRIGPGYQWWSTGGSLATHQKNRTLRAIVLAANEGSAIVFDIAKVRITYTYAVLK